MGPIRTLTRDEANQRRRLIRVHSYALDLDLSRGADHFRVVTRIRFDSARAGASTFVEHLPQRLVRVQLNGADLEPEGVCDQGRITLADLRPTNELVVESDVAYSKSEEGLRRITDPEDGRTYVYSYCYPAGGPRIFPCFDQPDLKASFEVRATVPTGWSVFANAPGAEVAPGRWHFSATPPLPTYVAAILAGPWHSVTAVHDGVELGLACKRSLARFLEVDELFALTTRGLDRHRRALDSAYPFPKYDQVFVPEFGTRGMENAACVVLGDEVLFRSRATSDQRRSRVELILHELAHMWFGDLVTMRWWDDLWLHESFATQLAHWGLAGTDEHGAVSAAFRFEKAAGFRDDALPTTHPVANRIESLEDGALQLGGIAYTKGAVALEQLEATLGSETYRQGLQRYLAEHAFGNASLDDLLRALEQASGRDLKAWADQWLRTAGVATLRPSAEIDADGRYSSFAVTQSAPDAHPTLRSHRVSLGLFDRRGEDLIRRSGVEVQIAGAQTSALAGVRAADLIVPDELDMTWAKLRLDQRSLRTVLHGGVPRIREPGVRAVLWSTLHDMVLDAELSVRDYLRSIHDGLVEYEVDILLQLLRGGRLAIERYGRPDARVERLTELADRCMRFLRRAAPASEHQLAYARGFVASAAHQDHTATLLAWYEGRCLPTGLVLGPDDRWAIVQRLATLGVLDRADIEAELAHDQTSTGRISAATARASLPLAGEKGAAWQAMFDAGDVSFDERLALARGFWDLSGALTHSFMDALAPAITDIGAEVSSHIAVSLSYELLPRIPVGRAAMEAIEQALAGTSLKPWLRRKLLEVSKELSDAIRARELDYTVTP